MARKKGKSKSSGANSGAWLVTFSDMMTLLLTFFVLLLTMSTLDKKIITTSFTNFSAKVAFLKSTKSGEVPTRITMVKEELTKPWEMLQKKDQIKDLLFPDQTLPSSVNRNKFKENIKILRRPEGVAIVLSDNILFAPGSSGLNRDTKSVLAQISKLINTISAPVNVSGHTSNTQAAEISNLKLSANRALSVLKYFLSKDVSPGRLSISGYGPNRPLAANDSAEGRKLNRRVEILLKTKPHTKTYL